MMVILRFSCVSVIALIMSFASAQEVRHGTVVAVDEGTGSVTIRPPPARTVGANGLAEPSDRFAVQDALLFDALHAGDKVTFESQEISGVNTITQLQKE